MLYGAHGSTHRLNTSIKPNSAIHSLHDLSGCIKHGHAHALKQSYSDSHLLSQAYSPAPRVGVCFVCSGRGRLGVRKPHRWAGLGIPILVGDEYNASAVLCVVCFESGYDRLTGDLQGKPRVLAEQMGKWLFSGVMVVTAVRVISGRAFQPQVYSDFFAIT